MTDDELLVLFQRVMTTATRDVILLVGTLHHQLSQTRDALAEAKDEIRRLQDLHRNEEHSV